MIKLLLKLMDIYQKKSLEPKIYQVEIETIFLPYLHDEEGDK